MKISEIKVTTVAEYIHLEKGDYKEDDIQALITTAVSFITSYTAIKKEDLEKYEDFYIVVLILCQDMYDNRTLYVDSKQLNRTVQTILNMHRLNLMAE